MAEYRRQVGLEVINTGIAQAQSYQTRGIESIADVVARREQDIMRKRVNDAKRAGSEEGVRASTDKRDIDRQESNPVLSMIFGTPLTDEAFNEAAIETYTAATQARVGTDIAGIEAASLNDVGAFDAALKKYSSELITAVPEEARGQVQFAVQQYGGRSRTKVYAGQMAEKREEMRGEYAIGLDALTDTMTQAIRSGDDDLFHAARAQRESRRANALKANLITEADALEDEAALQDLIVVEGIKGEVMNAFDTGGVEDAVTLIKGLHSKKLALSASEKDKLIQEVTTDLKRRVDLFDAAADESVAEKNRRQEENYSALLVSHAEGNSIDPVASLRRRDISPTQYKALNTALVSSGSPEAVNALDDDILNLSPDAAKAKILTAATGGSISLDQMIELNAKVDKLSVGTPMFKEGMKRIKSEIQSTGPMSKFDTTEQLIISELQEEFGERVGAGESVPAALDAVLASGRKMRADALGGRLKAQPMFSSPSDLKTEAGRDAAMDKILDALMSGEIDQHTANTQEELVEAIYAGSR